MRKIFEAEKIEEIEMDIYRVRGMIATKKLIYEKDAIKKGKKLWLYACYIFFGFLTTAMIFMIIVSILSDTIIAFGFFTTIFIFWIYVNFIELDYIEINKKTLDCPELKSIRRKDKYAKICSAMAIAIVLISIIGYTSKPIEIKEKRLGYSAEGWEFINTTDNSRAKAVNCDGWGPELIYKDGYSELIWHEIRINENGETYNATYHRGYCDSGAYLETRGNHIYLIYKLSGLNFFGNIILIK